MKKAILIPIIIGSVCLTLGGALFAIGVANNAKNNKTVTNTHDVSEFSNINIDIDVADLEFKVSTDSSRKVEVVETEKLTHTVEVKDDTLNIKSFDARKWYEYPFSFSWSRLKVTIYTPSESYANATIKSSTGDIIIPSDYSFDNLNIKVSTGNINVKSDVNEKLAVEASTGNVNYQANAKVVDIKTSTGNINLNDLNNQSINIKCDTGRVNLVNVLTEDLKIKTSTGDVKITDSDASNSIDIETSTGDVNATLLTGKTFDIKTSTGSRDVPDSLVGAPLCKIKTSTGDIKVKIK